MMFIIGVKNINDRMMDDQIWVNQQSLLQQLRAQCEMFSRQWQNFTHGHFFMII